MDDELCDAIRTTESDLHKCFHQIPPDMLTEPQILAAIARHPCICDLHSSRIDSFSQFRKLLKRASDRESLRDCVRYAQMEHTAWDPEVWRRIPEALWQDKEMCLELVSWFPLVYGILSIGLQSDQDIIAVFLAANPEHYCGWSSLLGLIARDVQLQHPEVVVRILKGYKEFGAQEAHLDGGAIALALWGNREVLLAWFRCGRRLPGDAPSQIQHDRDLWL